MAHGAFIGEILEVVVVGYISNHSLLRKKPKNTFTFMSENGHDDPDE